MKKVLPLILCAFISTHSYEQKTAAYVGKKIYLTKTAGNNTVGADGFSGFQYHAGDTLVMTAAQNPWSWAFFTGLDSVTIINEGGQVVLNWFDSGAITGGFQVDDCKHIHITGTGTKGVKYGFLVTTPANRGVGIDVHGRSAWVEIDHCEMYNKDAGFWIKEEQASNNCQDSLSFPNWVLHDFVIHDNYIHNMADEGMYLGSTAPDGYQGSAHPAVYCSNGRGDSLLPMRLGNFHIFNNIFDSTGRTAIQLSSADSGVNQIDHNQISNVGFQFNNQIANGIALGSYTQAYVHDNIIWNTYASGILSLGAGTVTIKHNKVNYSGYLAGKTTSGFASVEVDTRNTTNPSPGKSNPEFVTFNVINNLLGSNTDQYYIRVYNTYLTYNNNNTICGNTIIHTSTPATFSVPSGITYSTCGTTNAIAANDASNAAATGLNNSAATLFPNPARDVVNVKLNSKLSGKIELNVYNAAGSLIQSKSLTKGAGETSETLNVQSLSAGLYTLQIVGEQVKTYLKFVKQ